MPAPVCGRNAPHAPYDAGTEVLLYALHGPGRVDPQALGLELKGMPAVVGPSSAAVNIFSACYRGR